MSSESAPKEGVETVVETSAPATPTDIELENSSDAPEENESIGKYKNGLRIKKKSDNLMQLGFNSFQRAQRVSRAGNSPERRNLI